MATPNRGVWGAACGRASGRPSAALRWLDREPPCRRHRAL